MNFKLKAIGLLAIITSLCFSYSKTDVPEGWASQGGGTTGGQGGSEVTVSSMSELKSAAGSSGKKIILVKPGTYSGSFSPKSDKSILGTAPGVLIKGSMKISSGNIIIRNIAIQDNPCTGNHSACSGGGDAIEIAGSGAKNIWLDHMDVMDGSDGNCDIKNAADNITITWTKFHYTFKKAHPMSNLIAGSDGETGSRGKLNITYAYCWWGEHVRERQPRGRFGKIHVLNNLYTSKRCNYILGPGVEMQMLIEHNVFNTSGEEGKNDGEYEDALNDVLYDWGKGKASWKSIGNIGTNPKDKNTNSGTVFTPPYTIMKMDASEVEAAVRKNSGNVMTLGETSMYDKVITNNVVVQPHITTTKYGWTLQNPGSTALSFVVVTLQGKTVLQTTILEAGKSIQMPTTALTLVVKFKGANAPEDIIVPITY